MFYRRFPFALQFCLVGIVTLGVGLMVHWAQPVADAHAQEASHRPVPKEPHRHRASRKPRVAAGAGIENSGATAGTAPQANLPFVAYKEAQNAGVKTCLPVIGDLLGRTVDVQHMASVIWNKEDANQRTFSATNFMRYSNPISPRSVGIVVATPTPGEHCDGSMVKVQPSSLSCDQIAQNLAKSKTPQPQPMGDMRLYPRNNIGQQYLLLPTPNNSCVVMTIGTFYGR